MEWEGFRLARLASKPRFWQWFSSPSFFSCLGEALINEALEGFAYFKQSEIVLEVEDVTHMAEVCPESSGGLLFAKCWCD